jgi:DNA-directed RNA polymerase subunit RPC12/RpoP
VVVVKDENGSRIEHSNRMVVEVNTPAATKAKTKTKRSSIVAESKFVVMPVGVEYICDVCKAGVMLESGKPDWSAEVITFPHTCNNCGTQMNLKEKYPTVRFERQNVG